MKINHEPSGYWVTYRIGAHRYVKHIVAHSTREAEDIAMVRYGPHIRITSVERTEDYS